MMVWPVVKSNVQYRIWYISRIIYTNANCKVSHSKIGEVYTRKILVVQVLDDLKNITKGIFLIKILDNTDQRSP